MAVLPCFKRRSGVFDCGVDAWVDNGGASWWAYEYRGEPVEFLLWGLTRKSSVHPVRV